MRQELNGSPRPMALQAHNGESATQSKPPHHKGMMHEAKRRPERIAYSAKGVCPVCGCTTLTVVVWSEPPWFYARCSQCNHLFDEFRLVKEPGELT
jgi:hypothetical protein